MKKRNPPALICTRLNKNGIRGIQTGNGVCGRKWWLYQTTGSRAVAAHARTGRSSKTRGVVNILLASDELLSYTKRKRKTLMLRYDLVHIKNQVRVVNILFQLNIQAKTARR